MGQEVPDSVAVGDFVLGRNTAPHDNALFVDAISGQSYTRKVLQSRVDCLARGLAQDFHWSPNTGSPWDKVVAIYCLNTVSISGMLRSRTNRFACARLTTLCYAGPSTD